jgi:hypothetical protein
MNPGESRRRTIGQEFRDSFRAGPRAWLIALVVFLILMTFPLLGLLVLVLAPLVIVPALCGAALGRLVGAIRGRWTLWRVQHDASGGGGAVGVTLSVRLPKGQTISRGGNALSGCMRENERNAQSVGQLSQR